MSSNNNHNSTCRFQEEIVSYLYDEASVPEKADFVAHLTNCASCTDELTAFGFVRSSIQEWHNQEIFALDMPALEIPALKPAKTEQKTLISNESNSWLENLKRLFALSPRFAFGSIAFAALAVCVGLIFVIANFSSNKNLAGKENQAPEQILAANNNTKIEEKISTPDEKIYASQPAPENQEKAENKFAEKQSLAKKESIVKTSAAKNKPNVPKTNNTLAVSKQNKQNRSDKIQKQDIPTLSNFDDDDDKSLRLADLFSEIDTE